MNDNALQSYAIEITMAAKAEGQFHWAIRRSGKLIERSDRTYASEAKAQEKAMEAIERDRSPAAQHGRR